MVERSFSFGKLILFLISFLCCVNLVFAQEEDKYELISVDFVGNEFAPSRVLADIIISKETPFWFWKFLNTFSSLGKEPIYFDSSLIRTDLRILKSYYDDNGFFQSNISYSIELDHKNKLAYLVFNISEGKEFKIGSYKYSGISESKIGKWLYNELIETKNINWGNRFSREAVETDVNRVVDDLKSYGYMLAERGRVTVTIDTSLQFVDVVANFIPGKFYRIKEITIEKKGPGKESVSDELLYDIVRIKPGDRYDHSQLNLAQIRLYRTGLFTSALINSVISDTVNNSVPINISADIGMINELGPELIVNNQSSTFNVGVGLNFTRKNFFGNARKFSVKGSLISQDIFNVNYKNVFGKIGLKDTTVLGFASLIASVEQPYLFGKNISGKIDFYGTAEQTKFYRYFTLGTKLGFNFESPPFTFFNNYNTYIAYELESITVRTSVPKEYLVGFLISLGYSVPPEDQVENLIQKEINESGLKHSNIIIGVDLFSSHADDFFSPTKGFNFQMSLEHAGLLPFIKNLFSSTKDENVQYYKINLVGSIYTNPWKPSPGGVGYKLRIGYMQKFDGQKSIAQNKLFYSGGSNSIRAWRARGLGPVLTYITETGEEATFPEIGGRFIIEGSIETRNRIIGDVGSVIFVDFGNTWEDLKSPTWKTTAVAVGTGLRYYSSFAPFRLDFGVQFYDPFSQKFIFERAFFRNFEIHFGIGEAF